MNDGILQEWFDATAAATSSTLTLLNNGADEKFQLVIHCTDIRGRYFSYLVADVLSMGAKKEVDLTSANIAIDDFTISWEDSCGRIRRYSQHAKSGSRAGFKTISVWWLSPGGKTEEQFVFGQN